MYLHTKKKENNNNDNRTTRDFLIRFSVFLFSLNLFMNDHVDDFDTDRQVYVNVIDDYIVVVDLHVMNYVDDDVYEIDNDQDYHLDDDDDDVVDDQMNVIENDHHEMIDFY